MSEERLDEALAAVQATLASLRLKPTRLDRERVMYLAGQASIRGARPGAGLFRAGRLWPLATAASLVVAVALGGVMVVGWGPQTVQRAVDVPLERADESAGRDDAPRKAIAETPGSLPRAEYLALRWMVLTRGVDALREVDGTASPEAENVTLPRIYARSIDPNHSG